jgi:ubiquinone/menaquinone biosynthesis C-methylase UbiE
MITFTQWPYLLSSDVMKATMSLYDLEVELDWWLHNSTHPARRFEYPWVMQELDPQKTDKVLDAGGGKCVIDLLISENVAEVHDYDSDPESLKYMHDKAEGKYPHLLLKEGTLLKLPYADKYFDKTICVSVLEHMPKADIKSAIDELLRVTKGKVIITMDVVLIRTDAQMDMAEFTELMKHYSEDVPAPKPQQVVHHIDDTDYYVALITLENPQPPRKLINLPFRGDQKIVELGGAPENPMFHPNVNVMAGSGVDIVADLNEIFPMKDAEYDGIFGSYILEHIRWCKMRQFLTECLRILKPGGYAFLVTANLLEQARRLVEKPVWEDEDIYMVFAGTPDYAGNYHHSGFSPESAVRIFEECGFRDVIVFEHPNCKTDMIVQAMK